MLAPASIPVAAGKNTENTEKNVSPSNRGKKLSAMTWPKKQNQSNQIKSHNKIDQL
jgi:hypothetical protein